MVYLSPKKHFLLFQTNRSHNANVQPSYNFKYTFLSLFGNSLHHLGNDFTKLLSVLTS